MKAVSEWIKNPDVEVNATGWPAVAIMVCIAWPFFAVIYTIVQVIFQVR